MELSQKQQIEIEIIEKLGEHFIGLWTYQAYSQSNKKPLKYFVTVCFKGKHFDTNPHFTPLGALKKGKEILEKLK